MKIKNVLLVLIVLVMIPEILLVTYVFNISVEFPQFYAVDFFTYLITNPLFFVIVIIVIIMTIILYFALQVK